MHRFNKVFSIKYPWKKHSYWQHKTRISTGLCETIVCGFFVVRFQRTPNLQEKGHFYFWHTNKRMSPKIKWNFLRISAVCPTDIRKKQQCQQMLPNTYDNNINTFGILCSTYTIHSIPYLFIKILIIRVLLCFNLC